MTTYKIVRYYVESGTCKTIKKGLTLEQAQAYCNKGTQLVCATKEGRSIWFDTYESHTYKVIRFFRNSQTRRTIKRGLTLALAQEHCSNPETSSSTCTNSKGKRRTREHGPWFDGYDRE